MLNNITNFFNLIKTGMVKTQLEAKDVIPIGTKDASYNGTYKPTLIEYSNFVAGLVGGSNGQVLFNDNDTIAGASNLYWDKVNNRLSGGPTPTTSNFVIQKDITNDFIMYSPATYGGIQSFPTSGGANTVVNAKLSGTHGGYGNVAMGLGTVQADGGAFFGSTAIGQASYARGIYGLALGCEAKSGSVSTAPSAATAIGYNAITTKNYSVALGYNSVAAVDNAIALGDLNSLLQIGGNFTPLARTHIRGLGNTSSTTSLLVQNSSGTEMFRVRDDSTTNFSNGSVSFNYSGILMVDSGQVYRSGAIAFQSVSGTPNGHGIGVGENPNSSNFNSAVLIASSTTKGFLPPRMTTAQRTAIASPVVGLMVYQTDGTEGLYIYKSTGWVLNS